MQNKTDKLVILWTSSDRETALKMVFMYAFNSKLRGWWDNVSLIVWGPSSKLLAEDTELQQYIKKMKEYGVELEACKACSDSYNVSDELAALGIDVKYMGEPLTQLLKEGCRVITI